MSQVVPVQSTDFNLVTDTVPSTEHLLPLRILCSANAVQDSSFSNYIRTENHNGILLNLQSLGTSQHAHLLGDQVGDVGSWVDAHDGTTYPQR